ncbi:hypothetical protein BTJ45_04296 [Bacillus mycoides]|nr:hypothetical protein BTJ45_04296 [Bacillus mycoides]
MITIIFLLILNIETEFNKYIHIEKFITKLAVSVLKIESKPLTENKRIEKQLDKKKHSK